jgi:hypothetical protein
MQPHQSYNPGSAHGPSDRPSRSLRARRTHPALPGVTMPTVPAVPAAPAAPGTSLTTSHRHPARRTAWKLSALGLLLALAYLLLYPLFAGVIPDHPGAKPSQAALIRLLPWLPHLYWTAWAPAARAISHIPAFDLSQPGGSANLLLVGFAIAAGLFLVAARVARNTGRERLTSMESGLLFSIIFALAIVFALLFLFIPAVMTQDALLYGLYGRMALIYHANPYSAPGTIPLSDLLHGVLVGPVGHPAFGPVWMDASLAVALAARESVANILLDFRLLALVVHLVNTLLVWNVLARLRPEARFSGTLLYAWNPAVLLLGIAEMHLDLVVILFILLAAFFYQRRALVLSWVCLLLATLMQPLSLLLLPLFLRLYWKATRGQPSARRAVWWLALTAISLLIVVLAYAPYYSGWGLPGIAAQLRQSLAPDTVVNSLAAAIQRLRFSSAPLIAWLAAPLTWTLLAAVVAGCLLLLGVWLTENLAYALLFAAWVYLALLALSPTYLAWSLLPPLALAVCSASARTTLLALLLAAGALLSYYFNLFGSPWGGQGLVAVGLPVLIWGWTLFLASTWRITRAGVNTQSSGQLPAVKPSRAPRFSRPPWPSRPSWPGRR